MSGKYALIIGNTEYTDLGLRQLNAPSRDAEDFSRVLKDKNLCEFDDVRVLLNQVSSAIIEAIDEFFDQKRPDDLLVLYFSGHGVRDELGSLYLAVKNTIRSRLRSTAIKSDYIRESMDQSRSKRQVLILDCCNSGAFPQGTKAELGGTMGMTQAFQGYGRLVLTASDATQFAWEGDKVIGKTDNSLFTHFLVKGLEGEADSNSDGRITVDELYDYAYEQISRVTPKQTPTKSASKQEGEIVLRQNIRIEDIKSAPLPAPLLDSIENPLSDIRLAAVQQLTKLLNGKNLGLARSARDALKRIAEEDDSRAVSRAAMQALEEVRQAENLALQKAEEDAERLKIQKVEKEPPVQEKYPGKKITGPEQVPENQFRDAKVAPVKAQAKHTVRQDVKRQDGKRFPAQKSVVKIPAKEGKYTKSSGLSFITAGGVIIGLVLFGFAVLRIAGGFRPAATEEPLIEEPITTDASLTQAPAILLSPAESTNNLANLPVLAGTALPFTPLDITTQNADQVIQLARWGRGKIEKVVYSPNGKMLAVTSSLGIYLYDSSSLNEIWFAYTGSYNSGAAFSPDGQILASGSYDTTVRLWQVSDGALLQTFAGHTGAVVSVAFSPDGQFLASGSDDNTIRLWRVGDNSPLRTLKGHTSYVYCVAFSLDGQMLVSGSDDSTIRLWRISDGSLIRTLEAHTSSVYSVTFSPDSQTLASTSYDDNAIRLWRVSDGSLLRVFEGHTGRVNSVAFSPDGLMLASSSYDKTIRLWQVSDGSLIRTLEGHTQDVKNVSFSPDGSILASGSDDGTIRLWKLGDGSLLRTLEGHPPSVFNIALSPDNQILASGSRDSAIRLWKVSDGSLLRTLEGHSLGVNTVAFSPDGLMLASGSDDGTIRLWEISDGSLLRTLEGHSLGVNTVAISPDGLTLASGSEDNTIRLWKVIDGSLLRILEGHSLGVNSISFSPDSLMLVSSSYDETIRLWRVNNGAPLQTLRGHTSSVISAVFLPNGQVLASGSYDGTVRLWGIEP